MIPLREKIYIIGFYDGSCVAFKTLSKAKIFLKNNSYKKLRGTENIYSLILGDEVTEYECVLNICEVRE